MLRHPMAACQNIATAAFIASLLVTLPARFRCRPPTTTPAFDEVIAAKTDILGEAAMRQAGGPTYDFFAKAMPPLRYVNTAFRHYPIVLAAPRNGCKARLVSNGSAINAKGGSQHWHDVGFPVDFFVGSREDAFGGDLARLDGPAPGRRLSAHCRSELQ